MLILLLDTETWVHTLLHLYHPRNYSVLSPVVQKQSIWWLQHSHIPSRWYNYSPFSLFSCSISCLQHRWIHSFTLNIFPPSLIHILISIRCTSEQTRSVIKIKGGANSLEISHAALCSVAALLPWGSCQCISYLVRITPGSVSMGTMWWKRVFRGDSMSRGIYMQKNKWG